MFKRIVSLALAVILLVMSIPLFSLWAFADDENNSELWQNNGVVDVEGELLPGGIRGRKTTTPTGVENEFLTKIEIESFEESSTVIKSAVLVLIDTSDESTLVKYKEIATEIISTILYENSPNIVAVATVGGYAQIRTDFIDVAKKSELLEVVGGIDKESGCYLDEGIRKSAEWLEATKQGNQNLIILSEGNVTYSSRVKSVESTVVCSENHTQQVWSLNPVFYEPYQRISSISFNRVNIPDALCQLDRVETNGGKYPQVHGVIAQAQAQNASAKGINISAVGFAMSESGKTVMQGIAVDGLYENKADLLKSIEEQMGKSEDKADFSAIQVVDIPNAHAKIDEGSIIVSGGDYEYSEGDIVWHFDTEGMLSYKFKWKVTTPEFERDVRMPIGELTEVYFKKGSENLKIAINQPKESGKYHAVYLQGVLVNKDRKPIDENGVVTENLSGAKKVSARLELLNNYGVNKWETGSSIELSADELDVEDGYILYPDEPETMSVTIGGTIENPQYYFPFVDNSLEYAVEHYIDGEETPFDIVTVSGVTFSEILDVVPDSANLQSGYARMETQNLPAVIYDNSTVIKVIYKMSLPEERTFTINYYNDGLKINNVSGSLPESSPYIGLDELKIEENMPENSQTERIEVDGELCEGIEQIEIFNNAVIDVYYVSKLKLDVVVYKESTQYSSESFYINRSNGTQVLADYTNGFSGYELEKIIFNGNDVTYDENVNLMLEENKLEIYYSEIPETLTYTLVYYKNGEEAERESHTVDYGSAELAVNIDKFRYKDEAFVLDKIVVGDIEIDNSDTATITNDNNVIDVYFVYDENSKNTLFNYYLNGELFHEVGKVFYFYEKIENANLYMGIPKEAGVYLYNFTSVPDLTVPQLARDINSVSVYCEAVEGAKLEYAVRYFEESDNGDVVEATEKKQTRFVDAALPYDSAGFGDLFENNEDVNILRMEISFVSDGGETRLRQIEEDEEFTIYWGRNELHIYYSEDESGQGGETGGENGNGEENGGKTDEDNTGGNVEDNGENDNGGNGNNNGENGNSNEDSGTINIPVEMEYTVGADAIVWYEKIEVRKESEVDIWRMFDRRKHNDVELRLNRAFVESTVDVIQKRMMMTLGASGEEQKLFETNNTVKDKVMLFKGEMFRFEEGSSYKILLEYEIERKNTIIDSDNKDETKKPTSYIRERIDTVEPAKSPLKKEQQMNLSYISAKNFVETQNVTDKFSEVGLALPLTGSKGLDYNNVKTAIVLIENLLCAGYVMDIYCRYYKLQIAC